MVFAFQSSSERHFQTSRHQLGKTVHRGHYLTLQLSYPHCQYLELQKGKVTGHSQYQGTTREDPATSCQDQEHHPVRPKHFQNVGNIFPGKTIEGKPYLSSDLESGEREQVCR